MLSCIVLELALLAACVTAAPTSFIEAALLGIDVNLSPTNASETSTSPSKFTIPSFTNPLASSFHVNSSGLPLVNFPLQDSWAGLLPISADPGEERKLYFWYWPSSAPGGSKSITTWLNGGRVPGCSSLEGWLQENGPLRFEPGMSEPQLNPNAWTGVSDMLYVDQPIGTGFSAGTPTITNETQLADQFYGFLQQFYGVFPELQTKSLTIAGESYAGYYIPFIAARIQDASPAEKASLPLSLNGLLMNDGVYTSTVVSEQVPTAQFAKKNQALLNLTDAQVDQLANSSVSCGYDAMLAQVTYPPTGPILLPNGNKDYTPNDCDLADPMKGMAGSANPCFNVYKITDQCPQPADPLYSYFDRPDVQKAINVPNFGQWNDCATKPVWANGNDQSNIYSEALMPALLATLPHGITLWHGMLDALLLSMGDRIMIQNMTWNGAQGFSSPPTTPLVVDGNQEGVFHSERGLTYIEVDGAGHMIPEDQPAVALHVFSYVLGLNPL